MTSQKDLTPLTDLASQVQGIKKQISQHLEIKYPFVESIEVDGMILLRKELRDSMQIATKLLEHMVEKGIFK